jgi:hypothetical protein
VRVEPVLDRLLGDAPVFACFVDRVERAVAGEPDLDDDRQEEEGRQVFECLSQTLRAYALQPEPQPPTSAVPGSASSATWNEWPQPQEETAFGLSILNPDSWIVSR